MKKSRNLAQVTDKQGLCSLQRYFAEMIRRPLAKDQTMKSDRELAEMIKANNRSDPHRRLEFYAQQYWWRITDSLDEDFPTVQKLLPPQRYQKLRLAYLSACPSKSFTLRNLGARFPLFITRNPHHTAPHTTLISEAAHFDWQAIESFDAAELPALSSAQLQDTQFPNKKLLLQPHVKLLKLNYPLDTIVRLRTKNHSEQASNVRQKRKRNAAHTKLLRLNKERGFIAIHRYDFKIHMKKISATEYKMLTIFQKKCSLAGLAKQCPAINRISAEELQRSFAEWMALGWLSLVPGKRELS